MPRIISWDGLSNGLKSFCVSFLEWPLKKASCEFLEQLYSLNEIQDENAPCLSQKNRSNVSKATGFLLVARSLWSFRDFSVDLNSGDNLGRGECPLRGQWAGSTLLDLPFLGVFV